MEYTKTRGNQDQGSSSQAPEPYESHMLHLSSKNLGRSSRTSVPTTALPGVTKPLETRLQDANTKGEHAEINTLNPKSCSIAQRPRCTLPRIVTVMFCPAPSRLEIILASLLGTTLPYPHQSHPVTSSLVTMALMMKTRRMCLQRLGSNQR